MAEKAKKAKVDEVIQRVVTILYEEKAAGWSVQDKGALMAAVKLQLQESVAQRDAGSR